MNFASQFLESALAEFRSQRDLAERAIAQLDGTQLHAEPEGGGNSIVILAKHVAGNQLSRWTDFLTTDGEKPGRNRDGEFVDDFESREEFDALRDRGWKTLFAAIEALIADDLERTVTIRGEPHTVARAIHRQISHYGYHVGQIVQAARALKGEDWCTLSIPRGGSDAFNRKLQGG